MNWFVVLQALKAHLEALPGLSGVPVNAGQTVPVPDVTTVTLIRGPSSHRGNELKKYPGLTVFVECWERDEGVDPMVGYQLISALEEEVIAGIADFGRGDRRINNKQIRVRIDDPEPDGDTFRPMVGSRTKVTISWQ